MKIEDVYIEIAKMKQQLPKHRNAIEPFQDLSRRVEALEHETKRLQFFARIILFICSIGVSVCTVAFIFLIINRLVN